MYLPVLLTLELLLLLGGALIVRVVVLVILISELLARVEEEWEQRLLWEFGTDLEIGHDHDLFFGRLILSLRIDIGLRGVERVMLMVIVDFINLLL